MKHLKVLSLIALTSMVIFSCDKNDPQITPDKKLVMFDISTTTPQDAQYTNGGSLAYEYSKDGGPFQPISVPFSIQDGSKLTVRVVNDGVELDSTFFATDWSGSIPAGKVSGRFNFVVKGEAKISSTVSDRKVLLASNTSSSYWSIIDPVNKTSKERFRLVNDIGTSILSSVTGAVFMKNEKQIIFSANGKIGVVSLPLPANSSGMDYAATVINGSLTGQFPGPGGMTLNSSGRVIYVVRNTGAEVGILEFDNSNRQLQLTQYGDFFRPITASIESAEAVTLQNPQALGNGTVADEYLAGDNIVAGLLSVKTIKYIQGNYYVTKNDVLTLDGVGSNFTSSKLSGLLKTSDGKYYATAFLRNTSSYMGSYLCQLDLENKKATVVLKLPNPSTSEYTGLLEVPAYLVAVK